MEVDKASHMYQVKYVKNSRAIGVLWGVFTLCFAIVNLIAFIDPHWLADTRETPGIGHFGLYRHCVTFGATRPGDCVGQLGDFSTILNTAFQVSTVFIGLSALFILLTICLMLLFFVLSASTVYMICFWFQLLSAICMIIGCVVFPAGWNDATVRAICGTNTGKYDRGDCQLGWAYILAIIGIFDALLLSILAAVLATRHVKLSPQLVPVSSIYRDGAQSVNGSVYRPSLYRGEVNQAYISDTHSTISRKSMQLQPISSSHATLLSSHPDLTAHPDDHYADVYSLHSLQSAGRHPRPSLYSSSVQDFQL